VTPLHVRKALQARNITQRKGDGEEEARGLNTS